VPDPIFAERRLAEIYDALDPVRDDLEVYADVAAGLGARTVLDLGCGTGSFACLLAERGVDVVAVDPAAASLDVARRKPYADRVTWLLGDATTLPPLRVDLATMTANVAQVFLTDEDWSATLRRVHAALAPGGHLVLETRDPAAEAWRGWHRAATFRRTAIAGAGVVESWCELLDVRWPLVTFRWSFAFEADGAVLTSDSTLRFRDRAELEASLPEAGYDVVEVRDAPDRPGRELVVVARRR
jgi:SAM-dependent methyltransferase